MALPEGDQTPADDDSFGAQQILKTQEKVRDFNLSGDASVFYTSNAALTRRDSFDDFFFVGDAALTWTRPVTNSLHLQLGAHASIFRYHDTSVLDFENLSAGVGAIWTPQHAWGIAFALRYDFVELLDRHSNELLQDHEFSLIAQKIIVLGRSHALSFGLVGSGGLSDPGAEQRDQIGGNIGYYLRVTRRLDADLGYRLASYFYNDGGRRDLSQIISLGLHYHLTPQATVEALLSGATNWSNRSAFEYDVFTGGSGLTFSWQF